MSVIINLGIEDILIPPRMTPAFQPADVSWFKSLKGEYHNKWNDWYLNSPKSFTAKNNLKSPGYALAITWISEIWKAFDPEIIKKSFRCTGITSTSHSEYNALLTGIINNHCLPGNIFSFYVLQFINIKFY